jgi:hypothetical protein
MAGPAACGKRWAEILASNERNLDDLTAKYTLTAMKILG